MSERSQKNASFGRGREETRGFPLFCPRRDDDDDDDAINQEGGVGQLAKRFKARRCCHFLSPSSAAVIIIIIIVEEVGGEVVMIEVRCRRAEQRNDRFWRIQNGISTITEFNDERE